MIPATRALAELKGAIASIPQQDILINTLGIQAAKDSSEIENIVTTHDELFREDLASSRAGSASKSTNAKEVSRYRQALQKGFELVEKSGLMTINHITEIQRELLSSSSGIRTMPGTVLKNA